MQAKKIDAAQVEALVSKAYAAGWRASAEYAKSTMALVQSEPSEGVVSEYVLGLWQVTRGRYASTSALRARDLRLVAAYTKMVKPTCQLVSELTNRELQAVCRSTAEGFDTSRYVDPDCVDFFHYVTLGQPVKPSAIREALRRYGHLLPRELSALVLCERGFFKSLDRAQDALDIVNVGQLLRDNRVEFVPYVVDKSKLFPAAKHAARTVEVKPPRLYAKQKRLVKHYYLFFAEGSSSTDGEAEQQAADYLRAGDNEPLMHYATDVVVERKRLEIPLITEGRVLTVVDSTFPGSKLNSRDLEAVVLAESGAFNTVQGLSASIGLSVRTINKLLVACGAKFLSASWQ